MIKPNMYHDEALIFKFMMKPISFCILTEWKLKLLIYHKHYSIMNLASIPASSIERLLLTKPEVLEAFRRDRNLVVQVMNDRRLTPAAKGRIMRIINDGRINPMIGPGNGIYNERMITNESFMVNDMVIPRLIPIVQHQTIMMSRYMSSNVPMIQPIPQPPLNSFKQMPINMAEL